MSKFVLKNLAGLYLVVGSGFIGKSASQGTQLSESEANCAAGCAQKMGLGNTTSETVPEISFAVVYVRKGDTFSNGVLTKASPNANLNQFDPSKRRFATRADANTHGKRFDTRRASKSDPKNSGTAGHIGFFVIETNDPVNSTVNPATGLTNSIK